MRWKVRRKDTQMSHPLSDYLLDPSLSPAYRRVFAEPRKDYLSTAHAKAEPRRFTGEPMTGFGPMDDEDLDERTLEERSADNAYHFREMQDADRKLGEDV